MMTYRSLWVGWVMMLMTAGPVSAKTIKPNTVGQQLIGCWIFQRTIESPVGQHHPGTMTFNSSVRCYRTDGYVTGVTFDAGDGWDWSHRYYVRGSALFSDDSGVAPGSWRHNFVHTQFRLVGRRLITTDTHGAQRTWSLLCRSDAQDVQCQRLHQRLPH
jgi:hypothetical protein